jgi:hypothetical protein
MGIVKLKAIGLLAVSGENCTYHPEVPADGRCSRCDRPFCRACLTLVQLSPVAGSRTTVTVGGYGGLLCIECNIKQGRNGALIFAGIGFLWLIMEFTFLSSVPAEARGFFFGPLMLGALMGLGLMTFGIIKYSSSQNKLTKFQATLPLKAKFPAKAELGIAKCPNCGGVLKKLPQKPDEVVLCEYCGTPVVFHYSTGTG